MRRLQPTQASINRLPEGSRNVLLVHVVPEAPRSRVHVKKVKANVPVVSECYFTLQRHEQPSFGSFTCALPITGHRRVCLLLQEAKLDASVGEV